MAVIDYIFQEETVTKQNFGSWLINKMQAAGWQQVGSNPPTSLTDATTSRFYMMKTTRPSDGLEAFVGINESMIRTNTSTLSSIINLELFTDYTPGAPGAAGTSSRSIVGTGLLTQFTTTSHTSGFRICGGGNVSLPLDTPLAVRFCITRTTVTLFTRPPSFYNVAGALLSFGIPDTFIDEKVTSSSILFGTNSNGTSNDSPLVCDTPAGVAGVSRMYEVTGQTLTAMKSPDQSGRFPLFPIYLGDSNTGIRCLIPSVYTLPTTGILDRDIIQVSGMNFEVMVADTTLVGVGRAFAVRI